MSRQPTGEPPSMPTSLFWFSTDRVNATFSDKHNYSWVSSYSRPKHWFYVDLGVGQQTHEPTIKKPQQSLPFGGQNSCRGRKLMWKRGLNLLQNCNVAVQILLRANICWRKKEKKKKRKEKHWRSDDLREPDAHTPLVLSSMLHYGLKNRWYCHFKEAEWWLNTIFTIVHWRLNYLALTIVAAVKHFWINYNNIYDHITIIYYQSKINDFFFVVF